MAKRSKCFIITLKHKFHPRGSVSGQEFSPVSVCAKFNGLKQIFAWTDGESDTQRERERKGGDISTHVRT